ncbi:hypothetical protein LO772_09220 [Yinghuangia sp. ASG 101]|uniref:hypothetical protein n=1 Tax=Yinghuangia sp. ASG 101 TaxID=2896848 RepID=UPI001E4D3897|nr:hypothetical protein [Yinghuangia sp. ASG 101]UGQ13753.1 hypothetical protein LO772_09220 [Yinghuangia sp. ASG 101]
MAASRAVPGRDGFRTKVAIHRARQGAHDHRVIRPARPLKNAALYDADGDYELYVDRTDGRRLGTLFLLAARSPHSLVYVPLRSGPRVPGLGGWREGEPQPLDLVLVPRSRQFRPTHWKQLRARMAAGNAPRELRTASVPETDLTADGDIDWTVSADHYFLRQHRHAATLFLTGESGAFREAARELFAVTKDGPPVAAKHPRLYFPQGCNYHVCRCLYDWDDLAKHTDWEQMHVTFHPTWAR